MGFTIGNVSVLLESEKNCIARKAILNKWLLMLKKCKDISLMGECWGEMFADWEHTKFLLTDIIYSSLRNNKASYKIWDGFNDAFALLAISVHNKTKVHRHFPWVLKLCRFFSYPLYISKVYVFSRENSKLCWLSLIGHDIFFFPFWVLNRFSDFGIYRTKSAYAFLNGLPMASFGQQIQHPSTLSGYVFHAFS